MISKVREAIEKYQLMQKGNTVLLGLSGGADSVCLFHVLLQLKEEYDLKIYVLHVHHGIRKETADLDASFCHKLCEENDVPIRIVYVDAKAEKEKTGESLEEAARRLRYIALRNEKNRIKADVILTAHHMNDQAETMLFQMIRGSGLRGLSGMSVKREDVIRPLLFVSKEEIRSYLVERNITWREDETNEMRDASRNVIRLDVLPALQTVRESAVSKLSETAEYLHETDAYFVMRAEQFFEENECQISKRIIPEKPFLSLHKLEQEYVIRMLLQKNGISMKDFSRVHHEMAISLFTKEIGKHMDLKDGYSLVKIYDGVKLSHVTDEVETENISDYKMEIETFPYKCGMEIPKNEYTKWFDYDTINSALVLRNRAPGDLFSTRRGTEKKLKDYLIDEKIPKKARDALVLVASEKQVVWILHHRMNENMKVTENTKTVLQISIRKKEENEG